MTDILPPSKINMSTKQSKSTNISSILDYKDIKNYSSRLLNISTMVNLKEKIDKLVNELTPVNVENDDTIRDNKTAFKQINVPNIYNIAELVIKKINNYPKPYTSNRNIDNTGTVYKNYLRAKSDVIAAINNGTQINQNQQNIVDDYESKMEKLNDYINEFDEYIKMHNDYIHLNKNVIEYSDLNKKFFTNRKESFEDYTEYVYKNCLINTIYILILNYSYDGDMNNKPHAIDINDTVINDINMYINGFNAFIDTCDILDADINNEKSIKDYKDAAKQKINSQKQILISLLEYYNEIYNTLEFVTMINTTNKNMDLIINAIIQYSDKFGDLINYEQKVAIESCRDYYVNKYKFNKIDDILSAYNIKKFDINKNTLYSSSDKYQFAIKIDEDKLSNDEDINNAITLMTIDKYPPSIVNDNLDIDKITITSIENANTICYSIDSEPINNQNWFKELSEESQTKLLNEDDHKSIEIYRTSFEIFPECKPNNTNDGLLIDEFCGDIDQNYDYNNYEHRNFLVIEFYKKYIEVVDKKGNKNLKAIIDTSKPANVYISILELTDSYRLYDMIDNKMILYGNLYLSEKISTNVLCFNYKPYEEIFTYSTIGMKFPNDKNFVSNCVNKLSVRNRLKIQHSNNVYTFNRNTKKINVDTEFKDAGNIIQQLTDLILNDYTLSPDGKILYPKHSEYSAFNAATINRYKLLGGYNDSLQKYENVIVIYYAINKIHSSTLIFRDLTLENLPTTYNQLDESTNYIKFTYNGKMYVLMFLKDGNEYISNGQIYIVENYGLIPTKQKVSIFFRESI